MRNKQIIFVFLFRFFSDFERKNFRIFAKKLQEIFKTTFYVSRGTVCGFFFKKFWTVLDFLQKPLWWFSKFYLSVQSKNCGRNIIFLFFFSEFLSDFERKIFQTFGHKTSRSFQNYLLRVQRINLWLDFFLNFWTVLDFLQKPLWWFSKFHLRVQSKNCGKNSFFLFPFQTFFDFW